MPTHPLLDTLVEPSVPDFTPEPVVLRVERELRASGDVSDPTWESVIQQIDVLSKEDLRRILDLLATS